MYLYWSETLFVSRSGLRVTPACKTQGSVAVTLWQQLWFQRCRPSPHSLLREPSAQFAEDSPTLLLKVPHTVKAFSAGHCGTLVTDSSPEMEVTHPSPLISAASSAPDKVSKPVDNSAPAQGHHSHWCRPWQCFLHGRGDWPEAASVFCGLL